LGVSRVAAAVAEESFVVTEKLMRALDNNWVRMKETRAEQIRIWGEAHTIVGREERERRGVIQQAWAEAVRSRTAQVKSWRALEAARAVQQGLEETSRREEETEEKF
jgi:hypothetical protein